MNLDISEKEIKRKKQILKKIKEKRLSLKELSKELQDDDYIVFNLIKSNGYELQFASDRLKNDPEIVIEAINDSGFTLRFASYKLRNNRDFALKVVKIDGGAFKYINNSLKSDEEILTEAIKNWGYALTSASPELRNDKKIVLKAIKQEPSLIEEISEDLKNDKEIILEAVKKNGNILKFDYIPNLMKIEPEIVEVASKTVPDIKEYCKRVENKVLFDELEDRGLGYLGILEGLVKEIETYGEEVENKCCLNDNTSWFETKKKYIEYYTKDNMETTYLWDCISQIANSLSEALREI